MAKARTTKTTERGAPRRNTTATKARPPRKATNESPGVTIRMYRQGLGDCFLITFREKPGAKEVRVMIDCGVFLRSPGEGERLRAVAEDLKKSTEGKIDLLIITHEHWDHISGFSHAFEIFKEFTFGEVWLSWAENGDDPDAIAIKGEIGKQKKQLQKAVAKVRLRFGDAAGLALRDEVGMADGLLGFLGLSEDDENSHDPAATKAAELLGAAEKTDGAKPKKVKEKAEKLPKRMDLDATMNWLRGQVRKGGFRSPGECRPLPGLEGVRAFILGPPRSASAIRRMDPRGDQGYELRADKISLMGAIESIHDDDATPEGPFEENYRIEEDAARQDPFFRKLYGFKDDLLADPGSEWRRIDGDWLIGGLSRLALQLDVGVNNTSLAIAFELPNGETLIFPGDAQIGNWLSWAEIPEFKEPSGKKVERTAKELLNRAVFYKVGHHGSHNATMRAGGLEEMTSGDLVAMIPTDQTFASTKKPPSDGWKMPAHGVFEALSQKTNGRIIRADRKSKEDLRQDASESTVNSTSWKNFINKLVTFSDVNFPKDAEREESPLYVEYTIPF